MSKRVEVTVQRERGGCLGALDRLVEVVFMEKNGFDYD